jgi:hypothetical protein
MAHRFFQTDLLASPSISRLRAMGVVNRHTKSVLITFGKGDDVLRREVRVTHRQFPNGGGWSFFACPRCSWRSRVLKICDGLPMCWRCCAASGRAIAVRAARRSSVMRREWRASRNCASSSTAVRRDCVRGEVARWIGGASSRFR